METHVSLLSSIHSAEFLHNSLSESELQGSHSFIRGINTEYDKNIMLEQWLRPLNEQDDYRIQVEVEGETFWILIERLPWDSNFFSMQTAKLNAIIRPGIKSRPRDSSKNAVKAMQLALLSLKEKGIQYIFSSVSPSDLYTIRTLSANGFELIETRCYYHRTLLPAQKRYSARLATVEDIPSLAKAASVMVNPFDRFHADLEISEQLADRMMEAWVDASIRNGFADATIVPDESAPEAFCTAKYHKHHWDGWGLKLSQPVLSAVAPRHKGWYVKLISETDEHLREKGAEHSFLITQITNNAVIRSWEKLGYQFGKGEHIFRKML